VIFRGRIHEWPDLDFKNPLEELERMRRRMDRLFEGFAGAPWTESHAGVFPLVNVTEDKDKFYVRAELPGVKTEELDISVTGNNLSVSGERKIPEENVTARYHRREREAGKFSRVISIPEPIDSNRIEAHFSDGVLTIILPKAEVAKPKQISIKAS
jgi:HSP20 family protein